MDWVAIIVQLLSGAVGGNVAGKLLKNFDLGTLGNSLAGIAGGLGLGQLAGSLNLFGANPGGFDVTNIISSLVSGGVGGGILMAVIGAVKQQLANK